MQALMHSEPYVHALGALTGNMAMQQVRILFCNNIFPASGFEASQNPLCRPAFPHHRPLTPCTVQTSCKNLWAPTCDSARRCGVA